MVMNLLFLKKCIDISLYLNLTSNIFIDADNSGQYLLSHFQVILLTTSTNQHFNISINRLNKQHKYNTYIN